MSGEGQAEEHRSQIELTEEQRENVRKMLARFGGHLEEPQAEKDDTDNNKRKRDEECEVQVKAQDDLFLGTVAGTTIEWSDLTPGCKKYPFVNEVCAQFEPWIRAKREIIPSKFKKMCTMCGISPNNNSNTLIACSVEQADPITLIHMQVQTLPNGNILLERIRFIT